MSKTYLDLINNFYENMELYNKCEEAKQEFRNKQIETLKKNFLELYDNNYKSTQPYFMTATVESSDKQKSLTDDEVKSIVEFVNTNKTKNTNQGGSRKSKKSRKTKKSTKRKRTRSKSTKSKKTRSKSKKSTKRKRTRSKSRNNNNHK